MTKWIILYILLFLQLIVICNIDDNIRESKNILIDLWNKAHKTYYIKQLPRDRIPHNPEEKV